MDTGITFNEFDKFTFINIQKSLPYLRYQVKILNGQDINQALQDFTVECAGVNKPYNFRELFSTHEKKMEYYNAKQEYDYCRWCIISKKI
jgi:hypothetical protein